MGARGAGFRQASFRQAGAPFVSQITSSDGSLVVTNPNGPTVDLKVAGTGGVSTVANFAALAALGSSGFTEGRRAYVQSAKAEFVLLASAAATRTNYRIAASGLAGFQWCRIPERNAFWEVQAAWTIDPTNSTGLASDDNSGASAAAPLLTFQEHAWRLTLAEINQATITTYLGDQQAGDNPTYSYIVRGGSTHQFLGSPTVIYTSTSTSFALQTVGTAAADDTELGDAAVPGGSFTAAGALAKGVLLKQTTGTVLYSFVMKDLGGTTARLDQPTSDTVFTTNPAFTVGQTYQALQLPKISSWRSIDGLSIGTVFKFVDWRVSTRLSPSKLQFILCYLSNFANNNDDVGVLFQHCCTDTGGNAFTTVSSTFTACSWKGNGTTQYTLGGGVCVMEGNINTLQGCGLVSSTGFLDTFQINVYDWTKASGTLIGALSTDTGGRIHKIGPTSGKGNTSKLYCARNSSQIISNGLISTGNDYLAASTTDANPVQWSTTVSTTQTPGTPPLDVFSNGVFQFN